MGTKRILVVGAGFAGAVVARELHDNGYDVTVIDKRNHIAGNAYDFKNDFDIRVHRYGPHLFHTNNEEVFKWLTNFTDWVPYEHHIKAKLEDGKYVPFPVNKNTLRHVRKDDVFKIFFEPYSKKMWGKYYSDLSKDVFDRVKPRDTEDDRCFTDKYQYIPVDGYTKMFENILNDIKVKLNTDYHKSMEKDYDHVFNSMAIDEYYDYCYGELPYRSIRFHTHTVPMDEILPCTTVNFTDDGKFTRVTEWKQIPMHGKNKNYSTVTYEEPCDYKETGEKYYPVITENTKLLYKKYKDIQNDKVTFIGRCGLYTYMDMHMVVSSSLSLIKKFIRENKYGKEEA